MLDLIRRPPLVARLTVNQQEVVEGGELELRVGQVITVTIVLTNQLLEPVCDCCVSVRLEQDSLGRGGLGAGALIDNLVTAPLDSAAGTRAGHIRGGVSHHSYRFTCHASPPL